MLLALKCHYDTLTKIRQSRRKKEIVIVRTSTYIQALYFEMVHENNESLYITHGLGNQCSWWCRNGWHLASSTNSSGLTVLRCNTSRLPVCREPSRYHQRSWRPWSREADSRPAMRPGSENSRRRSRWPWRSKRHRMLEFVLKIIKLIFQKSLVIVFRKTRSLIDNVSEKMHVLIVLDCPAHWSSDEGIKEQLIGLVIIFTTCINRPMAIFISNF